MPCFGHHHHSQYNVDEEKLLKLLISKTAKGTLEWHRKMETNSWETETEDYLHFRLRSHMIYIINNLQGTETAITFRHSNADLVRILEHLIRDGVKELYHRHHLDAIQIIEESDEEDIDYSFAELFGDLHSDWADAKVRLNLADVDKEYDYEENYAPKEELIKWKPHHHQHPCEDERPEPPRHHIPHFVDPEDDHPLMPPKPHHPVKPMPDRCECRPVPPRTDSDYKDNDKYPVFDNVCGTGYNKPVKPTNPDPVEDGGCHHHHHIHLPDLDI